MEHADKVNIVIADDHVVLRLALCELLESQGKYNVIAQASNGKELLELLKLHSADLVILDVTMPEVDGLGVLAELSHELDSPPILVLSANEERESVKSVLQAGAKGYLPKHVGFEELEFAIKSILSGKTYLSPSITEQLMSSGIEKAGHNPVDLLTKREIEILTLLASGKTNREIGKELHISIRTVDTHRSNILKKLKLKTNAELVKVAIQGGLITF